MSDAIKFEHESAHLGISFSDLRLIPDISFVHLCSGPSVLELSTGTAGEEGASDAAMELSPRPSQFVYHVSGLGLSGLGVSWVWVPLSRLGVVSGGKCVY